MPVREQPRASSAAPADVPLPVPAPSGPAPSVPALLDTPASERRPRPRVRRPVLDDPPLPPPTTIRSAYRRIGTSIALAGAALLGGLMWYYGGVFSLDYLADTFAPVAAVIQRTPWWQHWWIPVLISAIEIFLWPQREYRPPIVALRLLLWLAVLAFDVLTTMRGLLPVLAQVGLPTGNAAGPPPWLAYSISGALGLAFAYLPEKIARWVLSDLWNLWLPPLVRRLRPHRAPADHPTPELF